MKNYKIVSGLLFVFLLLLFSCEKQSDFQTPALSIDTHSTHLKVRQINPCAKQGYTILSVPEEQCTAYWMYWFDGMCIKCN